MDFFDLAWFAGLFEGEGCISISKRATVRLDIAMSDKDVLDRVQLLFGGVVRPKRLHPTRSKPSYKPMWYWRVGRTDEVVPILTSILPWLGERRAARAREALERIAGRPGRGEPRSTHCKNGHELIGDNLMTRYGTHYQRCKTCVKANWTRANQKRVKTSSLS